MKRWGLRASSLSADTKADAGQKHSCNHLNPNVLYMMLATGVHLYPSVCHLFCFYFLVTIKLQQPIHKAQIYFVFLSVGK